MAFGAGWFLFVLTGALTHGIVAHKAEKDLEKCQKKSEVPHEHQRQTLPAD